MNTMPFPCLTLVTDRKRSRGRSLSEIVEEAVAGGVTIVQLREKDLAAGELFVLAEELREITRGKCLFTVNGRPDIAIAVGADGVHLPEDGLPISVVRRLGGSFFLVGCSTHNIEGAVKAQSEGADYIHLGTIFPTESKPGLAGAGLDLVRKVTRAIDIPVIAIGGIDATNASAVMTCGAKGVAVISAITEGDDVQVATADLREAISPTL